MTNERTISQSPHKLGKASILAGMITAAFLAVAAVPAVQADPGGGHGGHGHHGGDWGHHDGHWGHPGHSNGYYYAPHPAWHGYGYGYGYAYQPSFIAIPPTIYPGWGPNYYYGAAYYGPHHHYHAVYSYPVWVNGAVVYRQYPYCGNHLFVSATVPLPHIAIGATLGF